MMKERILILGAGLMQSPAFRFARELGLESICVDGNPEAEFRGEADSFYNIDLKDKEGILRLAREQHAAGIFTCGTDFSASVAYVAEKLGLPGIPYETALDCTDKVRMRTKLAAAGVGEPKFKLIKKESTNDTNYTNVLTELNFPLVVKPCDNMGARGCRRVDNLTELKDAVDAAMPFSRSGRVIVEEYMDGPEFSVDALVFDGKIVICGLADRHIFFPPYFVEMGHTMPTELATVERAGAAPCTNYTNLINTFCAGVRALGITLGAAKGDIKLTAKGPMIGEIAARLSGGYMSGWTYPYSSGVEPVKAAMKLAVGRRPDADELVPKKNWTSAERAFISEAGTVKAIHGVEEAKKIPFVKYIHCMKKPGDKVVFPHSNVEKCGNVITAAPTREEAVKAAEDAVKMIKVELE
jgi:biotin carboxylase